MYSAFFREEKEFQRRIMAYLESPEMFALRNGLRNRVARGVLSALDGLHQLYRTALDKLAEIRKALRRERISREILEAEGVILTWQDEEDKHALEKLKTERYAAATHDPFSDESGSEDEMDGEDDDDHKDEHTDEDSTAFFDHQISYLPRSL